MVILRILLLAFNVAVLTFLIYRMLEVYRSQTENGTKVIIFSAAGLLIVLPVCILLRLIPPSLLYFLLYPVAISLLLYLIRNFR